MQFIKGFANLTHLLYDVLGQEVKMGPVQLPPEAHEAMEMLKQDPDIPYVSLS